MATRELVGDSDHSQRCRNAVVLDRLRKTAQRVHSHIMVAKMFEHAGCLCNVFGKDDYASAGQSYERLHTVSKSCVSIYSNLYIMV